MAGPVTAEGIQVKAPQIWGPTVTDIPYREMLERALGLEGRVLLGNDMWAAASDIVGRGGRQKPPMDTDNFVVITVSSGIGSKVVTVGGCSWALRGWPARSGTCPFSGRRTSSRAGAAGAEASTAWRPDRRGTPTHSARRLKRTA
jgi:hypothetical protein